MNHPVVDSSERPETAEAAGTAELIRASSLEEHRAAESRPFIVALMRGELSLDDYARYLAQLAWVYEALESRDAGPRGAALFDPALARLDSIENDLTALGVRDWRTTHPALPATRAYVDHVAAIAPGDIQRLIAHHYTRYLGDLSGGQAISRLVARHYAATPEQLSFYRFDAIDDIVQYKRAYREHLNELDLSDDELAVLVPEVKSAYGFNQAIFDELAA